MKNSKKNSKNNKESVSMSLKILMCLGFFTILIVTMLWVIQVLMSDTLYATVKQREVDSVSKSLENLIKNDSEELAEKVDEFAEDYNICIKLYSVEDGAFVEEYSAIVLVNSMISNANEENLKHFYEQAKKSGGEYRNRITLNLFEAYDPSGPNNSVPLNDDELTVVSLRVEIIQANDGQEHMLLLNSVVTPLETAKKTIFAQFSYIIVFLIFAALGMAVMLSTLISKPLKGMNESAKKLAAGDYNVDFDGGGYREIDELSDTLNYAARELSKNDNLQKELIANISHDLRTPLTMIKGYGELMRDIPSENTPENLQAIIEETERLSELVNDLLDLSKLESGAKPFEPNELDLTETILKAISRYDKMKSAQGYIVNFDYDCNVKVSADRTMLLQILYNLINNAINYCGEDLYVGVKQEIKTDSLGNKTVRISVIDHGDGIEADKLPLIWDRYYKLDTVHRRATVGTGIGLSIVKNLLIKHGASYGVESCVGEGSTFWFELPVINEH